MTETAAPTPDRRTHATIAQIVLGLRIGGLERVVVDLVNHTYPGVRSVVICLEERGPLSNDISAPHAAVVELHRRPGFRPWLALSIRRKLRAYGVDLVHTHNLTAGFYGALGGWLMGVPIVHTRHGPHAQAAPRHRQLHRLAYGLTDHVVAVSEDTRRLALQQGARESALSIIDNGIDTMRFASRGDQRLAARHALALPEDAFVIGCVARLAPQKNHDLLLASFGRLARHCDGRDAWLVLVGGGPSERLLRDKVGAMDTGHHVVFTGARTEVEKLLPAFDVFALASDSEGLPVALLEAMAAGLPPVVTGVGSMPQVVEHGRSGVVVRPGDEAALADALAQLRSDDHLRARLGGAARERVTARYDVRRMARDYAALYSRLLQRDLC